MDLLNEMPVLQEVLVRRRDELDLIKRYSYNTLLWTRAATYSWRTHHNLSIVSLRSSPQPFGL
ncbi:hypothetical protein KC19_1G097500 [Ceratodon purpureus]|uniref:Uncharacterized protein n=1 Tax=Ceratodon purpureus TaxID=3225 RepID=A0A8T0J3C1_CERPU|nr:hypothetical protein KC19_1G097500 [Ceratodon purpureus]